MVVNNGQQTFPVINTEMTVRAMRDSGYKSTTHALAELIDNSIEANATHIELFGLSQFDMVSERRRVRLKELAVLDDGEGMDFDTLRGSLRYGIGTKQSRKGIGRFGLGLPNSSMSQARRVEVWSWQSGATNAFYTWLSIDDVESGMEEIPIPTRKPIPTKYRDNSLWGTQDSGTLVVWSDLDRVQWARASTVFKNTEYFVGRIYRRFITNPDSRLHFSDNRNEEIGPRRYITMIPLQEEQGIVEIVKEDIVRVRPNDPLYLMPETSCPEQFGEGPMFQELEGSPVIVKLNHNEKEHKVQIRASYARPHVRDPLDEKARWPDNVKGWDSGNTAWGKHANGNRGVSIVRAHREIDLDLSWLSGDDPRERWWSVEVDFPTELDEIFGVVHNKQGAVTFQSLARMDWKLLALDGEESPGDVRRRLEEEGNQAALLWEMRRQIMSMIKIMRRRVRERVKRRHSQPDDEKAKADAKATATIKRLIEAGKKGISDKKASSGTIQEHQAEQIKSLVRYFIDEEDARLEVELTKDNKVRWVVASLSSPAFFDVDILPGVVQVVLNENHPVFAHLYELIDIDADDLTENEVRERLAKATAAFRVLIYSWARYEDESVDEAKRTVQNARIDWGNYAAEFFAEDDYS